MNSLAVLQALAFEPQKAFAALAERPRVLFPLLLLILAGAGMTLWFYRIVDVEWFTDQQLRSSWFAGRLSDAQIEEQSKQAGEHATRGAVIAMIGVALWMVIVRLLEALYFLLAGKLTNVRRGFGQWLALASWTSLPSVVLGAIPAAVILFTTTTSQFDQGELQPLSLNALFFHRAFADPGYSLLIAINLLQFVGLYLAASGVRAWSGRSWLFSAVFASLPWALIVGVWAYLALGRS